MLNLTKFYTLSVCSLLYISIISLKGRVEVFLKEEERKGEEEEKRKKEGYKFQISQKQSGRLD